MVKPRLAQVAPPSAAPSHCSMPSMLPLPQLLQAERFAVQVAALQVSVPPKKPYDAQLRPPKSVPSQSSVGSRVPLPQLARPIQSHII